MKPDPWLLDVTELPTPLGTLRAYAFCDADGGEVVAVVRGRVWGRADVAVGISTTDGSAPPSTALGMHENAVVLHFRPRAEVQAEGVRRRGEELVRRLALAHVILRRLGVRSAHVVVTETRRTSGPETRMEKR